MNDLYNSDFISKVKPKPADPVDMGSPLPTTFHCPHCRRLREGKRAAGRGWVCVTCDQVMVTNPTGRTTVYGNKVSGTSPGKPWQAVP